jgi:hypothetical protein
MKKIKKKSPTGPTKIFELVRAFVFQCFGCGKEYAAPIPEEGSLVEFKCECSYEHKMLWTGKAWKVTTPGNEANLEPAPFNVRDDSQIAEDGLNMIRERNARSQPRPPLG